VWADQQHLDPGQPGGLADGKGTAVQRPRRGGGGSLPDRSAEPSRATRRAAGKDDVAGKDDRRKSSGRGHGRQGAAAATARRRAGSAMGGGEGVHHARHARREGRGRISGVHRTERARVVPIQGRSGCTRFCYSITVPPSTAIVWPVTNWLPSEMSQAIVPVRSDGSRVRWIDWPARITSRPRSSLSARNSTVPSVITALGATAFTRILSRPSSRASPRVRPITAALDVV